MAGGRGKIQEWYANLTPEERKAHAQRAGKRTGSKIRKRADELAEAEHFATIMKLLLEKTIKTKVDKNGVPRLVEDIDTAESLAEISSQNLRAKVALGLAVVKEGLEGNIKAVELALRLAGEDTKNVKEINLTGGLPIIIGGEDEIED